MKNLQRTFCAVAAVGFLMLLTAATIPSGAMRYTFYTTNTTADIDARIGLLAGSVVPANVLTNGQFGPTFTTMRVNAPSDTNGLAIYGPPGLIWLISGANIYGYDGVNSNGTPHVAVSIDSVGDYVTEFGDVVANRFYGNGIGITNITPTSLSGVGIVYGGTATSRDGTTPTSSYAIWVITDSVPPYQLSVWANGVWN